MKLKSYDKTNTIVKGYDVTPKISFNAKTGVIRISAMAAKKIGLKVGDTVALAQDEDKPADWYLYVSDKGFTIKNSGKDNTALKFGCKEVAHDVVRSSNEPNAMTNTLTMILSTDPVEIDGQVYYPIATKTARISYIKKTPKP